MDSPMLAAVLFIVLIGLVAGFALGWAARRDDNRRYRESRERHWRRQLQAAQEALEDRDYELVEARRIPAPAPAAPVVNVLVAPPAWQPPTVLPVNLDALPVIEGTRR